MPREDNVKTTSNNSAASMLKEVASDTSKTENGNLQARVLELTAKLKESQKQCSASERRVSALTREREFLRKARDSRSADTQLVKEKDKQIAAIMAEGEKLSIKIAEKESSERELRFSLREIRQKHEALTSSFAVAQTKVEASAAKIKALETSERDAVEAKEAAERRLREIGSETRSLASSSAALEAARAQLESLRKSQTASLENQAMRLKAESQAALEETEARYEKTIKAQAKSIEELRSHLSQTEETSHWKEDQLRASVESLRLRCEALESRNESLAAALPNATKPLLREVSALQSASSEHQKAAAAAEASLLNRLRIAEQATATATERSRASDERAISLSSEVASLREQLRTTRASIAQLSADLRSAQSAAADTELQHQTALEEARNAESRAIKEKMDVLESLSKERAHHVESSNQANSSLKELQADLLAKEGALADAKSRIRNLESSRIPKSASSPHFPFPVGGEGQHSEVGINDEDPSLSSASLAESFSAPGGMYMTERLGTALRVKTGEVENLQAQLKTKETATTALADEVVSLTTRCEELTKLLGDAPDVEAELEDLKKRHKVLLELFGEREERMGELEADLEDIRKMNKEQITELLLRIESLQATG